MESPKQIEAILEFGSKSSTYKYALLKTMIDYIMEHPTETAVNGFHYIPGIYLAKKFLRYYWPLSYHGIKQGTTGQTAVESAMSEFRDSFYELSDEGFSLDSPEAVLRILERIETAENLPTPYVSLLQDIRNTVIDMPVRYVRNIKGEVAQLFTVYHQDYSLVSSDFEDLIREGKKVIARSDTVKNYLELELAEPFHILISDRVYDELTELRFWIDSIITEQWSRQCQEYMEERFPYGEFFASLSRDFGDREPLVSYREFYRKKHFPDFYTNRELSSDFAVDHFLPWSRLPVNRFWNLVPTKTGINSKKSDRLLQLTDEFRNERLPNHMDRCLRTGAPVIKQDLQATYRKYHKREVPDSHGRRVEELRELVLQLYDNLDQISVEEKINPEELIA